MCRKNHEVFSSSYRKRYLHSKASLSNKDICVFQAFEENKLILFLQSCAVLVLVMVRIPTRKLDKISGINTQKPNYGKMVCQTHFWVEFWVHYPTHHLDIVRVRVVSYKKEISSWHNTYTTYTQHRCLTVKNIYCHLKVHKYINMFVFEKFLN